MYALVDCNNFYVSCERVFRPDLNGKPVIVLSNNDGCVISRSNEAKALGIAMGVPAFKIKDIIKQHNVEVFSSNFRLYGDLSRRVMTILTELSPEIEIYSIDEAFLKFDNVLNTDFSQLGLDIRKKILKYVGIPVSVGFAPTKSLAKVAIEIAKKFPQQTQNVYVIDTEEKRIKALRWLPVEDIWGIGRQLSAKLQNICITKAIQFTQLPDSWLKKNMTIVQLKLKRDLCGIETLQLEDVSDKKSIATTRSFDRDYTTFDEIRERIVTFANTCAYKLRLQKSLCQSLIVFVHTNFHKKEDPQYSQSIVIRLPFATNSSIELAKFAVLGLEKIFKDGFRYKKAGVIVSDLIPQHLYHPKLFDNSNPKHKKLMQILDKINQRYGSHSIHLASQEQQQWKMNQQRLSPNYTTNLAQVIEIKAI